MAVFALWSGVAEAAPRQRTFDIPAQSVPAALLQFAVQANVSISLGDASQCRGRARALVGAYGIPDALQRLLAGSGCDFRMIDATTVRIVRAQPPPPAPSLPAPPAPPGPPPPPTTLGEVVVTATRREALADRLPYAVSTSAGATLAETRTNDVGALAEQTAGLTVTNLGPGRDKIILRGLSDGALTGRTQATVGIYLDDVRITYNAPDPDLRLTDIDRTEVLRGPQGALYGAGSIGGIYRIVTRQPELDRYGGFVAASVSTTRDGRPGSVVEGALNAPILKDRLALRAVAYREVDGGYIDDVLLQRRDVNRSVRSGFRVGLRLRIDDDWTLSAGLTRQGINSDDTQYAAAPYGPLQRGTHLQEPHDNDFTQAFVAVQGETPAGRFKNAFSIVRHDLRSRYDATDALAAFGAAPAPAAPFDDDQKIEMLVNEMSLTSAGAGRLQWLVGNFYAGGEQDLASTLTAQGAAAPLYSETRTDLIREAAVYGEVSYALTDRLRLSAGARAFLVRVSTTSQVRGAPGASVSAFAGKLNDWGLAPQASLSFQATDATLFYLRASEGYRAGGFNTAGPLGQVFGDPGGTQPLRRFGGDELWSFEAGVKTRWLDDRLRLRLAAFSAVWKNIQSDQLLPSGLPFTANLGEGRNLGLEAEGAFTSGGLLIRANALVDSPELTRRNPGFPAVNDSSLAGAPHLSFGAAVRYRQRLTPSLTGDVEAEAAYVGSSTLTFDALTAPRMGGYVSAHLSASLESGGWRATAFVDNPTNSQGDTFAYGNPFTLRLAAQRTPQRPRTAGLRLSRTF